MPAKNNNFPWLSYYGHYKFFEQRMYEHRNVSKILKINTGLYKIQLNDGRDLIVFICECYAFSDADYFEVVENYGPINAVVISSNWCSYDFETKLERMKENVGVFDIGGFMAAINKTKYWEFMTEQERNLLERSKLW